MPFIQLKPREQSFISIARDLTKRLSSVVLCEGSSDVDILKAVVEEPEVNIGITDCGGIRETYEVARYVAVLAYQSRRLRSLGILVNADEFSYEDRARSLLDSLVAHGIPIKGLERVDKGIFKSSFRLHTRRYSVLICIAGVKELPLSRHCIEDHIVSALLMDKRISRRELEGISSSKDFLESRNIRIEDVIMTLRREKYELFEKVFQRLRMFVKLLTNLSIRGI